MYHFLFLNIATVFASQSRESENLHVTIFSVSQFVYENVPRPPPLSLSCGLCILRMRFVFLPHPPPPFTPGYHHTSVPFTHVEQPDTPVVTVTRSNLHTCSISTAFSRAALSVRGYTGKNFASGCETACLAQLAVATLKIVNDFGGAKGVAGGVTTAEMT